MMNSQANNRILLRVNDIVLYSGCYGRVVSVSNQMPDGSGTVRKNVQIRFDGLTQAYGRRHPKEVKRLG